MLVRLLEEPRKLAVDRHLVQRTGCAGDRVERREDEGDDQHDRDQPVDRVTAATKDLVGERDEYRPRVGRASRRAEDEDERDRDQRVDEHAVPTLEVHRDLGVAVRVLGLADVAGGRLHRDHVPREEERERDVDRQPAVPVHTAEEAAAVELLEPGEVAPVNDRRLEDPRHREERQRDHRE